MQAVVRVVVLIGIIGAGILVAPLRAQDAADPAMAKAADAAVIDMHLHALPLDFLGGSPPGSVCSPYAHLTPVDPADGYARTGGMFGECVKQFDPPATNEEIIAQVVESLERNDIVGVASGFPDFVMALKEAAPDRIIPALVYATAFAPPMEQLREMFTDGGFMVLGEMITQYEGYGPDAEELAPVFAMAEELDIPVALHMGPGPPGVAYAEMPGYRAKYGDPLLLEDVLTRHPNLRLYVMHAGYPRIDNMIAVMGAHPQVYVDIGVLAYIYPRDEFYAYLKRLIDAGMEDRIMYGSDQMVYPEAIDESLAVVRAADFLTEEQLQKILKDNAARFLRIGKASGGGVSAAGE